MFKIWAKTIVDHRIVKNSLYENDGAFDSTRLYDYVVEICYKLDIPTPIVLKQHISNLHNFNVTRFLASDFVESVPFDMMVLEYIAD